MGGTREDARAPKVGGATTLDASSAALVARSVIMVRHIVPRFLHRKIAVRINICARCTLAMANHRVYVSSIHFDETRVFRITSRRISPPRKRGPATVPVVSRGQAFSSEVWPRVDLV